MKIKNILFILILLNILTKSVTAQEILSLENRTEILKKTTAYLIKHQDMKGDWSTETYPTVMTALAGLGLLSAGFTPTSGPYSKNIEKTVLYLLNAQRTNGIISNDNQQEMYSHGFSTLFLSLAYGMSTHNIRIKHALVAAVNAIAKSQSRNGGWHYQPFSNDDEGSVTIVEVQALRAARDAGIQVPHETIQRSVDYIRKSQTADGSIAYQIGGSGGTLPLTAAGMAVLFNAGEYTPDEVQTKGFEFLDKNFSGLFNTYHFYYTNFYAAQVFKQRGESFSNKYFSQMEKYLLANKILDKDGDYYWNDQYGTIYATAIATMILAMPLEYLPIFAN